MIKLKFILSAALLLLLSVPDAFSQADRRQVRAGNRDFKKEDYRSADVDYRKALLKDSTSLAANYNLANTCYLLAGGQKAVGSLDEASRFYAAVEEKASESGHAADYWFNVGDLAIARKDWSGAVDAFKKSLLANPDDLDAKENYIYARKKMEDQQNNQDQNQNQNQNQDQNQDQNQNQDQQNNQDQNQDQQNNQDQNQNQDQDQNQNQDQNQDQNQGGGQQNGQREPQISPQAAQQMLQAIQAKEKETQDKVNKEKALMLKSREKEKNW